MNKESRIYLAGHEGMVGSALYEELNTQGYKDIIVCPFTELDLRNQQEVMNFVRKEKPEYLFLIAGKVGGIQANISFPGEFMFDNLAIATNVIEAARLNEIEKMIFLGSSCIYPRLSEQPMREEYLLTGSLEPTNEGYALGKIAGVKLCEYYNIQYHTRFFAAIPPNLYGLKDNFSPEHSHVISALIRKFHEAKVNQVSEVEIWGTGKARREFLFSTDLARALIFLMNTYEENKPVNVGSGIDFSITELAAIISEVVGYEGGIRWDTSKPDGMPRKIMDSERIFSMGWKPGVDLKSGVGLVYDWYKKKKL